MSRSCSVLFTGKNFNLQKEWFQPIQRIFQEKKKTQIRQIFKKKWNPKSSDFYDKFQ